jgi:hypothetical protein
MVAAIGSTALLHSSTALGAKKEPPAEWDGLTRVASSKVDHLYKRPEATLAGYTQVKLDPILVEFDKNWKPNEGSASLSTRVTSDDMERMKSNVSSGFADVFNDALTKAGYKVVDQSGDNVLRVSAAIANLYVTAPPNRSSERVRSYTTETGRMTLVCELRDSVTNQLLARAVDTEQGRESIHFQLTTAGTNTADARIAFGKWADILVEALDAAKGSAAGGTAVR